MYCFIFTKVNIGGLTWYNRPMIKVSIVVPIYKVEKYLRECVDSILAQTLKDIEIILVDDGSPDACPEIIDNYAKQDSRVVAVHQENSGYSKAVNHGIELARGEYIGIIESDDWIEPDMYDKLYSHAKKYDTDITKGMFTKYNSTLPIGARDEVFRNPSGVDLSLAPDGAFTITEWPRLLAFHASIWSSIYRADFIKKIKVPETAGASYQDFPFMMDAVTKAKRISVVRKPFVHWRNDPEQGNSTSAHGEKLLLMAKNSQTGIEIVKQTGKFDELKEALYVHVVWTNMGFFQKIDRKHRKEYYRLLRELLTPLRADQDFRYTYFRPQDKLFLSLIVDHSYPMASIALAGLHAKQGLSRGAKSLFSHP